jgi:hypothetical protein
LRRLAFTAGAAIAEPGICKARERRLAFGADFTPPDFTPPDFTPPDFIAVIAGLLSESLSGNATQQFHRIAATH